jgi:hypothetical protein
VREADAGEEWMSVVVVSSPRTEAQVPREAYRSLNHFCISNTLRSYAVMPGQVEARVQVTTCTYHIEFIHHVASSARRKLHLDRRDKDGFGQERCQQADLEKLFRPNLKKIGW